MKTTTFPACLVLAVLLTSPAPGQQPWDPADTDADGLSDEWEQYYFSGLDHDAAGDPDLDSVSNTVEFQQDLNPTLAMTDGQSNDWEGLAGYLRLERWDNVPGGGLAAVFASAAFKDFEPQKGLLDLAELPADYGDNHAVRLRGTLRAPTNGDYRFYIASDDQSQLWLGSDSDRFSRRLAAYVDVWTAQRQWTKYSSQESAVITLQEGQDYWFEVVMQEGSGADNLSVGWLRPGQSVVEVIPGTMSDGTVVFHSHTLSPDDLDDDGLPDTWELSVGLNSGDDGRVNAADGGYSDWDGDGFNNFEEWLSGGDPLAAGGATGYVRRDIWSGISGSTVAGLTSSTAFTAAPGYSKNVAADLDFGSWGDSYGQRVRGCVVPPHSGNWRFWIASDDASELYLSSSAAMSAKRKIAYVSGWAAPGNYDATPSQKSGATTLTAGTPYFFEILHKEGVGGDHVSVAWAYEPVNLALASNGSTATQSTTYSGHEAGRAIDGNTSGVNPSTTMAHTQSTLDSWWQVDFGQDRQINRVVLFNRTDALQNQQRLSNFRISVLDATGGEIAGEDFFTTSGYVNGSMIWNLPATVTARKVKVRFLGYNLMGNGFLCLAEVQAFEWVAQADRQVVSASFLRSAAPDPLDADGDSLPDAWEIQYGLNPLDKGSILAGNGEYGDPDADLIPNFVEFVNGTSPVAANGEPGLLTRETWTSLAGDTIHSLVTSPVYLDPASSKDTIADWQFTARADYYGQRLRGILTAPATGAYTFWIAGDNECRLSLSTDSRKFLKRPLASVGDGSFVAAAASTGPGNSDASYDKYPSQRSQTVQLEAGGQYFIEVLHKEHGGGDHVAVAWRTPGASREPVPFTALRSFLYEPDDADDDDLPDSWESQYGLDPGDNGRFNPGIEGALGDADADQLSNREEYLLGTDPLDDDSDSDGLGDYAEVHSLHSDPLDADSGAGAALADLAGSAGTSVSGEWIAGPNETMLSLERRGIVAWDFNLANSGFRLLEVLATPQGNTWAGAPLDLGLAIVRPSDSARWTLGNFPLRDDEGAATRVLTLLPWLEAGSYRAEITVGNISQSRNVRIDRVRVLEASGVDSNSDGVPDWIEGRLAAENGLLTTAAESLVSPVCLEGLARDVEKSHIIANGQNLALTAGIDDRWFADLALPADGSAQPFAALFEGGVLQQNHTVAWTATNVLAAGQLTIRRGDSLRLTAFPGTTPDQGTVVITGAGATINTTADLPVSRAFNTTGTFTVAATHTAADSTVTTGTMTLDVVTADFGSALSVRAERWRDWTLPGVPAALPLEFDSRLQATELAPVNGARTLRVAAWSDRPLHIVARSAPAASIAARGTVDPYQIGDAYDSGYVEVLDTLPGGIIHGRISVVADRLPPGGYVQIQIWAGGAQFADGTTVRNLHAGDFGSTGVAYVDLYYPSQAAISSFCAYYRLYDGSNHLLSGY